MPKTGKRIALKRSFVIRILRLLFFCPECAHALRAEARGCCAWDEFPCNGNCHKGRSPQGVTPGTRPGLRPPASSGWLHHDARGLKFLHPRPTQTPEGHASGRGPSNGNPSTPIGSRGPYQAGGQAPPFHRVTKPRQGEFYAIPRHYYCCNMNHLPLLSC